MMEWISVKERLPKNTGISENVILHTRNGKVVTGWLEIGAFKWWILEDADYHESVEFDYVTHWMPLPEPPKEEA